MRNAIFRCAGVLVFVWGCGLHAQSAVSDQARITVRADQPGHVIPSTLFGIFLEDINLGSDGGLYPELVRNRSFEDADSLQHWSFDSADGQSTATICVADVQATPPVPPLNPFNRQSLLIRAKGAFTLGNNGYWGMNIEQGQQYALKLAARSRTGFDASLTVRLIDSQGKVLASGDITEFGDTWVTHTVTLTATGSDPKARLEIGSQGSGELYLDMVSLLPQRTWKGHGLRPDLAGALDALKPAFFRFPGGCWVEGDDFAHMNNWKHTIGDMATRRSLWNIWGYNATRGLGYHEFLQLAEDLDTEPMYCINAGISHKEIVPMDQMGQWVQDALDAIEYANGPVDSLWGGLRAKNGHPEPFNMKYLEIGNENGQGPYAERWAMFVKAIRAKYPDMILIANEWAGSHPQNPEPAIVDEHYYNNPDWFIWNANQYDSYDRNGPQVFVGEYAVTSGTGRGNLRGAIGEAAFMIGMERNCDVVVMAAYAPLLCNVNHQRWPINLINFDSSRWYGLPSYYVQQMFATNQGTVSLPAVVERAPEIEAPQPAGCIGLGTWNNAAEFKDLKVTTPDGTVLYQNDFTANIDDWRKTTPGQWSVQDGVLRQSAIEQNVTAFVGDPTWTDVTITLKARKLSGDNGFQIYFHNQRNGQRFRWDIGGYNNSVYLMDIGAKTESISASVEAGRWYDIKIEILGSSYKGYLDGKLIQEVVDPRGNIKTLNVSAAQDESSGDLIVKVVNTSANAQVTQIDLTGAKNLTGQGTAIVLTSVSALDENTLDNPTKVSPQTESITVSGTTLTRTLPGNSMTVLRLKTDD